MKTRYSYSEMGARDYSRLPSSRTRDTFDTAAHYRDYIAGWNEQCERVQAMDRASGYATDRTAHKVQP